MAYNWQTLKRLLLLIPSSPDLLQISALPHSHYTTALA